MVHFPWSRRRLRFDPLGVSTAGAPASAVPSGEETISPDDTFARLSEASVEGRATLRSVRRGRCKICMRRSESALLPLRPRADHGRYLLAIRDQPTAEPD